MRKNQSAHRALNTFDSDSPTPATPGYSIDESIHNRLVEPRKVTIEEERQLLARQKRRVTFVHVEIREYERYVSDNPAVECSVGIGLGWRYEALPNAQVDDHEELREQRNARRRRGSEPTVWLSPLRRKNLLEAAGVPEEEIRRCKRAIVVAQKQRRGTMFWVAPFRFLSEAPWHCWRDLRRTLRGR